MKHLFRQLLFIILVSIGTNTLAQETFAISGIVTDEKHEPIKSATVFISGSQQATATDANGRFTFGGMAAGNYLLSAKMLGYAMASQPVTIHDKSVNIAFSIEVKPLMLNEVKISVDKDWEKHYAIFKKQFLGTSVNAKKCVIVNPEIIHFNSKRIGSYDILLKAEADDFLIIENKQLGYRIKYLLKSFQYNSDTHLTFYDGDNSFEELEGTDDQKKAWVQNRSTVYKGSLMHFLRSVFANTVLNEGFITNQLFKSSNVFDPQTYMNPSPVKFDSLVTTVDTSFISFKFSALNISYDPEKALGVKKSELKKEAMNNTPLDKSNSQNNSLAVNQTGKSSQVLLHLKEAIIDARGSVSTGYRTFLIRGKWADSRIADQLPFEYLPPKTIN